MARAHHTEHSGHCRPFVAPAAVVGLGALAAISNSYEPAMAESHRFVGAFAYSDATGTYGYGVNYRNSEDASDRALRECRAQSGATDCVMVQAFGGLCAALTVLKLPGTSTDGQPKTFTFHFVGTSPARADASDAGIKACMDMFTDPKLQDGARESCKVIKVVCSDDRR